MPHSLLSTAELAGNAGFPTSDDRAPHREARHQALLTLARLLGRQAAREASTGRAANES